jgi:hypothetical protein
MRLRKVCRPGFVILVMVLLGSMYIVGAPSKAYEEDSASGKIIELQAEDRDALAVFGRGVVGDALPVKPITDTARLMPLNEGTWTYRVLAGDHKDANQKDIIARPKHDKSGRSWRRVVGKKCIEYYRVRNGGKIEIASEVDLVENVITRYTPMFPVMFDGMRPGEKKEVETDIRVYDLHDPAYEKYRGHLKVTHTYVGAYEVTVPAGKYQTILIKSSYTGKVGPASVNDVGYKFYAEDAGIVASVERSHVAAFLFYDKRTKTQKVLVHKERGRTKG